jgi:hypothetical protein
MNILEDENTGKLTINGQDVDGFIDTETCPACQQNRIYHYEFGDGS